MTEHRRNPRIKVDRAINIILSDGSVARAKMVNISIDGIAITYPSAAERGAELGLSFQIPSHDDIYTVNVKAIVRHSYLKGSEYVSGLEFLNMNPDDRRLISRFISNKLHTHRG